MNIDSIRERFLGEFRPFAIRTSDGREYSVQHPYSMIVSPRTLVVLDGEGRIVTVNPLHVVALKDLRRTAGGRAGG